MLQKSESPSKLIPRLAVAASYAGEGPYIYGLSELNRQGLLQTTYLRSSIRMVSMVNSLFHCTRQGSLDGSTFASCQPIVYDCVTYVYLSISLIHAW